MTQPTTLQAASPAMIARRKKALIRKFTLLQSMNTGRYGDVKIHGTSAGTNGNYTVLPMGNWEDPEYLEMLEGMMDHENGHNKHTSFEVWFSIKNALIRNLTNIFEDLRIERLVGNEYPGAKINLIKLVQIAIKKGLFSAPVADKQDLVNCVTKYLLYFGRHSQLQQLPITDYALKAESDLKEVFPKGFPKLEKILNDFASALSTQDALNAAEAVFEVLKEEKEDKQEEEKQEEQDQDGQSGDSDDSDDEQDSESGSGNSDDSDDEQDSESGSGDSNDSDDEQDSESDSSKSNESSSEDIEKAMNASDDEMMKDMHEAIREMMEEKAEEALEKYQIENNNPHSQPLMPFQNVKFEENSGLPTWIPEAKQLSQRIKTVLHSIMQDRNRTKRAYDTSGLDLCSNSLWGVKAGNARVFKTETMSKAPNSAFSILIDRSGSMNMKMLRSETTRMEVANVAAFAIAQALEMIKGAACEVLYYPFNDGYQQYNHVAKSFNERIGTTASRSFNVHGDNGTPTGQALDGASASLSLRPEPRKVMFLITDGDTYGAEVSAALKQCDLMNITVIGIGIGTGVLTGFEERPYFSIEETSDLSNSLFSYLREHYRG